MTHQLRKNLRMFGIGMVQKMQYVVRLAYKIIMQVMYDEDEPPFIKFWKTKVLSTLSFAHGGLF